MNLSDFADLLDDLASDTVRSEFTAEVGEALTDLVVEGFQKSTDPYGNRWKPTKRGNPPLVWTGDLAASPAFTSDANGVTLEVSDWKAVFHQGTRMMLPGWTLPTTWEERVRTIFTAHVHRKLGH